MEDCTHSVNPEPVTLQALARLPQLAKLELLAEWENTRTVRGELLDSDFGHVAALQKLESLSGPDKPYLLVRRAADIGRAYEAGKIALLPRLDCTRALHANPNQAASFAKIGYRWLAPYTRQLLRANRPEEVRRIAAACRQAGVLFDTGTLTGHNIHAVMQTVAGWPVARFIRPQSISPGSKRTSLGDNLLLLYFGDNVQRLFPWAVETPEGVSPGVIVSGDTRALALSVWEWGKNRGGDWYEPGSSERRAIRAGLGGRLEEWLRRTEAR